MTLLTLAAIGLTWTILAHKARDFLRTPPTVSAGEQDQCFDAWRNRSDHSDTRLMDQP